MSITHDVRSDKYMSGETENQNIVSDPICTNGKQWWWSLGFRPENVRVITITPVLAKKLLERNIGNRQNKKNRIDQYARSMSNGLWMLNGETIIFDTNGHLRNGQNRLEAVVKSGTTITAYAVFQVDPNAFSTLDAGATRTGADTLFVRGEKNCTKLAATIRNLFWYRSRSYGVCNPSNAEIESFLNRHSELTDIVSNVNRRYANEKLCSPSIVSCAYYLIENSNWDPHDSSAGEFWDGYFSGESLFNGNPVLALRRKLLTVRTNNERISAIEFLYLFSHAWAKFARQQEISLIRLPASAKDREFPSFGENPRCLE